MFVVHCKRCKHCRSDYITTTHGEDIHIYFCGLEYEVVDPNVERDCEQFEEKE